MLIILKNRYEYCDTKKLLMVKIKKKLKHIKNNFQKHVRLNIKMKIKYIL